MGDEKLILGQQIKDATIVGSLKLQDGTVTKVKMAAGSVGATQLETNAVTNSKINDVNGSKLVDATVTEAKLDATLQNKIDNPAVAGLESGDAFSLFAFTDNVKYNQSTSDLYKNVTPASNFWHPSYSLAGFSNGVQSIGYGATVDTTLTNTTNKQFYFATDLVISGSSNCTNNAAGMYFVFNMPFRGIIWVGGVEVYNNLDVSDTASIYTTKYGPKIVNIPSAQDNLTVGGTTRIAILYKQESGQASLVFKVAFGTAIGGSIVIGPDSFATAFSMDTIPQGSAYIKITAAEYATLSYIPTSAEKTFLTTLKADDTSLGGITFNDEISGEYVHVADLAEDTGAATVGFDDTGFGFVATTVQAAIRKVVDNISGVITFDNTIPAIPGLTATPTIQEGINKLAYAANLHIDGTQWTGILAPSALYVQNALDKLRDAVNIRFDNTTAGIATSPATVQAACTALAVPNNVPFVYAGKLSATTLGAAIRELRDRFDSATNTLYPGSTVGIPATEVKGALDYIVAHLPASNEFLYTEPVLWTTIKATFAALGITVPANADSTPIEFDPAVSYLYEGINNLRAVTTNEFNTRVHSDTYHSAGSVSNDYTIPTLATTSMIDVLLKDGSDWRKIEGVWKSSNTKFDGSYYDPTGVDISNDMSALDVPFGLSGEFLIRNYGSIIRTLGILTTGQSALVRVRFA